MFCFDLCFALIYVYIKYVFFSAEFCFVLFTFPYSWKE